MAFLIWQYVFEGVGYNNNNNDNICPISQAPRVKWKSYIVFLCAQGCKLRRPTTTSVVGTICFSTCVVKSLKNVVFLNIYVWNM